VKGQERGTGRGKDGQGDDWPRANAGERRRARERDPQRGKKKALCGNRRPSNDCLPYEKSSKIDVGVPLSSKRLCPYLLPAVTKIMTRKYF
jgi:hypothetical protein